GHSLGDRGVRAPLTGGRPSAARTRRAHRPRARGARAAGPWSLKCGDRRAARGERGHREDARGPRAGQAAAARPRAGGDPRLRVGRDHAWTDLVLVRPAAVLVVVRTRGVGVDALRLAGD